MPEEFIYNLDRFSAVLAREDIDGADRQVMIVQDRRCGVANRIMFQMTPTDARQLATRLRKYANFIDPPKPRRK